MLVIIGLIVGSVLAGQSLIAAAAVRAQITQIEKFNTAATTFRDKYGGLPGDLQLNLATQFGFNTTNCFGTQGNRDGNGLIDGTSTSTGQYAQGANETALFWQDLTQANLIENLPATPTTSIICNSFVNALTSTQGPPISEITFRRQKSGRAITSMSGKTEGPIILVSAGLRQLIIPETLRVARTLLRWRKPSRWIARSMMASLRPET